MAGQPQKSWFLSLNSGPHTVFRLYCFGHAGAGPSFFSRWHDHLPAAIEVCAAQLPGREARFRESASTDWVTLVRMISNEINHTSSLPFAFFGHSLGALLAFELAHALAGARAQSPVHLIASGTMAPHVHSLHPPLHDLPDAEFHTRIEELGGTPPSVLADEDFLGVFMPVLRADFRLAESYLYRPRPPLQCPITTFGGEDDVAVSVDGICQWKAHTQGRYNHYSFPGKHFFLSTAQTAVLHRLGMVLGPYTSDNRTRF